MAATAAAVAARTAPGRRAFTDNVSDGKQQLLPVAPHTDRGKHRDVRGLPVQTRPDHGAIENKANDVLVSQVAGTGRVPSHHHLAPGAADHILADCALEQPEQRALDPARVGPGQEDHRDQRFGLLRQPAVPRQRLRAPLAHLALLILDPSARHAHSFSAEANNLLPVAMPVPVAIGPAATTVVAHTTDKFGQFLLEH